MENRKWYYCTVSDKGKVSLGIVLDKNITITEGPFEVSIKVKLSNKNYYYNVGTRSYRNEEVCFWIDYGSKWISTSTKKLIDAVKGYYTSYFESMRDLEYDQRESIKKEMENLRLYETQKKFYSKVLNRVDNLSSVLIKIV